MNDQKKIEDTKQSTNMKEPLNTCREGYTIGQMLTHNIPLLLMYFLGTIIIGIFNIFLAGFFVIYLIFSNYVFMLKICAYCPHYGSKSSLCGYGLLTKFVTSKKRPKEFKKQFKRYIAVLFADWFLPVIFGVIILIQSFNWFVLILLIIFIIDAFGIVLIVSRSSSCKTCKLRGQCPWSSICGS